MVNNAHGMPEEPESSHPEFSRLSILRTIWKRKIRITVAWILFSICAVVVVRMLPPVFVAETVVLIDSQKIPEKFVSATVADDTEERIASIRQMLLSGAELKKVIGEFGLYKEELKTQFEEEILDLMRKDISITLESAMPSANGGSRNTKRPGAFRIGYQGSNPALVMQVANRLTDLCVEQNLRAREGQAAGTSDFLDAQLRDSKKRLDEMEAAVSTYKLEHNGELPQQENAISGTLARLQIELEANRDAINRAQQTKVVLESSVNAMENTMASQARTLEQALRGEETSAYSLATGQPGATQRVKASDALEIQLATLRARLAEDHPDVVHKRMELENVKRAEAQRQSIAAAPVEDTPPGKSASGKRAPTGVREPPEFARTREQLAAATAQISGMEAELENRQAEQKRILRDLEAYQRRIERLPVREQEMAQITRDYEMSKENYKSLLDKKMAAEMSLNMERRQQSERFIVLDRAQLPEKPVKPKRPQLYAGGLVAALLLGLVVGFVAELRQNVFLGEWELPPGTPVLARLPYIEVGIQSEKARAKPRGWFARKKQLTSATVTALLLAQSAMKAAHSLLDRL